MSTKGKKLSPVTRGKISLIKTKHTKVDLIQAGQTYFKKLEDNPKDLPTLSGFCLVAGIHPTNLQDYVIKYAEVRQIAETIELLQEEYCLTHGITNRANPIFSMFLLKSKHRYQEQPTQLTQNNNFSGITPELMADALKLMQDK